MIVAAGTSPVSSSVLRSAITRGQPSVIPASTPLPASKPPE